MRTFSFALVGCVLRDPQQFPHLQSTRCFINFSVGYEATKHGDRQNFEKKNIPLWEIWITHIRAPRLSCTIPAVNSLATFSIGPSTKPEK